MSSCPWVWPRLLLILTMVGSSVAPVLGDTNSDDAELVKALGTSETERLLEYLRGQILTAQLQERLEGLIRQLGDPTFRVRQAAQRQLIEQGPVALPLLRRALVDPDQEVAGRARRCLQEIQQGPRAKLPALVIQTLMRRKESRLLPLLFDLKSAPDDDPLTAVIVDALINFCQAQPSHLQSLREALDTPQKRSIAVLVLLRLGDPEFAKRMPHFLDDADPSIRFEVARALLRRGDRKALPALISVIRDTADVFTWQQAEELLYAAAGELAPVVVVKSADAEGRRNIARQWDEWWNAQGDQILLGRDDDYPTDVCVVAETGINNRVYEWRPSGKPRFEIRDLISPVDARVLPGKRVLIAEQAGRRISERSFAGQLIWERVLDDEPVSVMRLANGNTFVATVQQMLEVRRDGEIVVSIPLPDPKLSISDANRLSDGRLGVITTEDVVLLLSSTGQELKRIAVDSTGAIEALPNGHILVSQNSSGRITEFDVDGKIVVDFKIPGAWMATRLPDQTYLVASKRQKKMLKVGRDGKVLAEHEVNGHPHAIHWR